MGLGRPTRPSRTNTPKRYPFHYKGLECKSRESRNTWSNRQIWPWNEEWSRAKSKRVLPKERTGHSKYSLPTTQEKTLYMDITRWSTPKSDWLYSLQPKTQKLYTAKQHQDLTVVKTVSSLLPNSDLNWRVGKTTTPFSSVQFSSVAQSCPTLCDPMNRRTPGLPVHHHLPQFTQTHVHRVCDAIQPSHPWLSPSSPAPNPSQHQSLFQWVNSSHEVAKVLELQL